MLPMLPEKTDGMPVEPVVKPVAEPEPATPPAEPPVLEPGPLHVMHVETSPSIAEEARARVRARLAAEPHRGAPGFEDLLAVADELIDIFDRR